jgi:hypothetical protein
LRYTSHRKDTSQSKVRDFDDNDFPLAYFISFRTYGTWLHGDERGSVSRKQNKYGTARIASNKRLQRAERNLLKHPPVTLDAYQRPVVEKAVREVCDHRGYTLLAINVRTQHVSRKRLSGAVARPLGSAAAAVFRPNGSSLLECAGHQFGKPVDGGNKHGIERAA